MIADEPSSVAEDEGPARTAEVELPVLRLKRGEDRRLRAGISGFFPTKWTSLLRRWLDLRPAHSLACTIIAINF